MKLLFELSGEHPEMPFAELECVGRVIDRRTQVAIVECPDPAKTERLSLTHVVMEYLGECDASKKGLESLLKRLDIHSTGTFAGRVKKMNDSPIKDSQLELERTIGSYINGTVSLKSPEVEFRAIFSADKCYFGRVIRKIDRGGYAYRNPMRRAFFHPGVMMPIIARALVNLSLIKEGELLFDPFCGTGGVLLEGQLMNSNILGMDMDREMVAGCRCNLPSSDIVIADATAIPLVANSVDAVVTDLPYGQSVCIKADNMAGLYEDSLSEIRRVLKPERRAVVVTHLDIARIAEKEFKIVQFHSQRVHKSLTRRIMVLE